MQQLMVLHQNFIAELAKENRESTSAVSAPS